LYTNDKFTIVNLNGSRQPINFQIKPAKQNIVPRGTNAAADSHRHL